MKTKRELGQFVLQYGTMNLDRLQLLTLTMFHSLDMGNSARHTIMSRLYHYSSGQNDAVRTIVIAGNA